MVDEKAEGAKVKWILLSWEIIGYMFVGFLISLTLPPKYDDNDFAFFIALLLWPVVVVLLIFFSLQHLSVKVRRRIWK